MPPRVIKDQLTCPFEFWLAGTWRFCGLQWSHQKLKLLFHKFSNKVSYPILEHLCKFQVDILINARITAVQNLKNLYSFISRESFWWAKACDPNFWLSKLFLSKGFSIKTAKNWPKRSLPLSYGVFSNDAKFRSKTYQAFSIKILWQILLDMVPGDSRSWESSEKVHNVRCLREP